MSTRLFAIELVHFTISCSNSTWAIKPFITWAFTRDCILFRFSFHPPSPLGDFMWCHRVAERFIRHIIGFCLLLVRILNKLLSVPKSELCFICVRGRSWGINYYHLSWKRKLGTVKSFKADVSSVTPSLERMANARNVSFETLHGSLFTLSTQLIILKMN